MRSDTMLEVLITEAFDRKNEVFTSLMEHASACSVFVAGSIDGALGRLG